MSNQVFSNDSRRYIDPVITNLQDQIDVLAAASSGFQSQIDALIANYSEILITSSYTTAGNTTPLVTTQVALYKGMVILSIDGVLITTSGGTTPSFTSDFVLSSAFRPTVNKTSITRVKRVNYDSGFIMVQTNGQIDVFAHINSTTIWGNGPDRGFGSVNMSYIL